VSKINLKINFITKPMVIVINLIKLFSTLRVVWSKKYKLHFSRHLGLYQNLILSREITICTVIMTTFGPYGNSTIYRLSIFFDQTPGGQHCYGAHLLNVQNTVGFSKRIETHDWSTTHGMGTALDHKILSCKYYVNPYKWKRI